MISQFIKQNGTAGFIKPLVNLVDCFRFTRESCNNEGGVIADHTIALNGVHGISSHGALHTHLMIMEAIGRA